MYRRPTADPTSWALTAGVVGSAWAFAPWVSHSFEASKYFVLAGAAALLWWGQARTPAADAARYRRALGAASAVLAVGLLATAAAESPARALYGSTERAQGLLALAALLGWSLGLMRVGGTDARRATWFTAVLWATVGVVGYAVLQALGADPLDWQRTIPGRPGGTFGNPNALAGWLALAWPTLLWGLGQRPWRLRAGCGLLLALLGLALAGSRTAWIVVALATVWLWPWPASGIRRLVLVLAGVLLALGLLAHGLRAESWRERLHLWQSAASAWAESPPLRRLIGYGLDQQSYVLARHGAEYAPSGALRDPDRAHHAVYDVLLSTGLLGLGALLWIGWRLAARRAVAPDTNWPAGATLGSAALLYAAGVPLAAELALLAGVLALGAAALPAARPVPAADPWRRRSVAVLLASVALPFFARSLPPQLGWPTDPIQAGERAFVRAVGHWPRTATPDCAPWATVGRELARALGSEPARAGYQRAWRQYLAARGDCPGPDSPAGFELGSFQRWRTRRTAVARAPTPTGPRHASISPDRRSALGRWPAPPVRRSRCAIPAARAGAGARPSARPDPARARTARPPDRPAP